MSNSDLTFAVPPSGPNLLLLHKRIAAADAVSFDFFDTLFVRSLLEPEDVFALIGRRFGIPDFPALRRAAQGEAFRRMHLEGRKEITFAGIYACFHNLGVPIDQLMQAEYDMEMSLVHPNAELAPLFTETVTSGKPVVLTSDMYLPANFFAEALELHGLPAVPIFVSSDSNATKRDFGELFDIVAVNLGLDPGQILHVGDNLESDVKKATAKGLSAFYYQENRRPPALKAPAPEASLARGLLRKHAHEIPPQSFHELGFLYGGPAAVGFLDWISDQAKADRIDHLLLLARDGYIIDRIAQGWPDRHLPPRYYFLGSRVVFTLAGMTETNFTDFLPFLLSGAEGLAPHELLERIGVQPPAERVMNDLGLGADVHVTIFDQELGDRLQAFLFAYRWQILKVCQRNRRALLVYLNSLGIRSGHRVAMVDIGWNGTTQDAFEMASAGLMDLEVFGYYFCLANTPDSRQRQLRRRMTAMVSPSSTSTELVDRIFANRVAVELFFSAPHPSVVGLTLSKEGGVMMTEEFHRGSTDHLARISNDIINGMETFAQSYDLLRSQLQLPTSALDLSMPLIEFVTDEGWHSHELLRSVTNFDCWSRSRNRHNNLTEY